MTTVDVSPAALRGEIAALLPAGWLAISFERTTAMFRTGDHAAVLAGGVVLAPQALVVGIGEGELFIGVPAGVAAAVADAVSQATAIVVFSANRWPG